MPGFFWIFRFVFVALSLVGLPAIAQPIIDNTLSQRDILLALYNGTNGASWSDKSGWLGAEGTECSWFGISCENDQIVYINLRNNNLTGTLLR